MDEFFGVAGDHHPAKCQGHNLGDLLWGEYFSLTFGIFVGLPVRRSVGLGFGRARSWLVGFGFQVRQGDLVAMLLGACIGVSGHV